MSVSLGDFVRADIIRSLDPEQIVCFDLAVHQSRLPVSEEEMGLAVLVSPLQRVNRRNKAACENKFACSSEVHAKSLNLSLTDESEADTVFKPSEDCDIGWEFRLARSCDWRGWSSQRVDEGIEFKEVSPISCKPPKVGIVVTIFNKPSRFVPCIRSVINRTRYPKSSFHLILINDGSDQYSKKRIGEMRLEAEGLGVSVIVREHGNQGYLFSANRGADVAIKQGCDYFVCLNSDVVVTEGWLSGMIRCAIRTGAGLVNPLSNQQAAISVPLFGEKSWGFPRLPGRIGYRRAAELAMLLPPKYPDAITSVGQCLLIDAECWLKHGPFDAQLYGSGYGEECELWGRLLSDGGFAKVADDSYVYHESHGTHELADEREKRGAELFISRWKKLYERMAPRIRDWPQSYKNLRALAFTSSPKRPTCRFIAYNIGPYGGVQCVLRIVDELNERGVDASVEYVLEQPHNFKLKTGPNQHRDATSLRRLSQDKHVEGGVLVATHWFTGEILKSAYRRSDSFIPLAFWQDREDLFIEPDGTRSIKSGWVESYISIPNRVVNADWVGASAINELGIDGYTHIPVGVDTELFYPIKRKKAGQVSILAMYRPSTPRRGAKFLRAIFTHLRQRFGNGVILQTFGEETTMGDINYGPISADEVAIRMRNVDIVVEPSEFQGFGLPGLEAIASGASLISTDNKGIHEYGKHESNCIIASSEGDFLKQLDEMVKSFEKRQRLSKSGREDALRFDWSAIGDEWAEHIFQLVKCGSNKWDI